MPRVAFQGDLGAFSEEAIVALWGGAAEPVPMREFRDVARAVAVGEAELGLLPVGQSARPGDRRRTDVHSGQ